MRDIEVTKCQIAAAVIGNALEWYDFIVYGYLTVVISRLFFPAETEYASLLLAAATFGVGFVMRPVGGILIGLYADRKGRKAALQLIMLLMTAAIALIAFAPTYASIGIAAPLIIVLARLLQGLATGGEFASATSFLVEIAPPGRRGFYGSLQMMGQSLAALVGATVGMVMTQILTSEQIDQWGWRLPFALGLLIGPVGLYIRRHLQEPQPFTEAVRSNEKPPLTLVTIWHHHTRSILVCLALVIPCTILFYVILIYMPTYAKTQLGIPLKQAFTAQVMGLLCLAVATPFFGTLADRVGRRPMLMVGNLLFMALPYPLFFWLLTDPGMVRLMVMQVVLCSSAAIMTGAISTALADQFPISVRSTGLALSYNTAVMIFGGFAQLIVTWLIQVSGTPLALALYVIFGAVLGFLGTLGMIESMDERNKASSS
jgi:MFS family permease